MEKLIVTKDEDDFKFDKVSYIKLLSILTSNLLVCYLQLHLQGLAQLALWNRQSRKLHHQLTCIPQAPQSEACLATKAQDPSWENEYEDELTSSKVN